MTGIVNGILKIHHLKRRIELRLTKKSIHHSRVTASYDSVNDLTTGLIDVSPRGGISNYIDSEYPGNISIISDNNETPGRNWV